MATILQLRRVTEPAQPTIKFPLFRRVFQIIQEKQNEIYNRKLKFLFKEAYYFFLDESDDIVIGQVDIPYFIYEQQRRKRAYDNAVQALLDVVRDERVDACYRKRVKQYKEEVKRL